jgi:NADP-dependent 3-hydroxy acid dehydrogenase YdfG
MRHNRFGRFRSIENCSMPEPAEREASMAKLKGKVAWVTGAGSGIGEAAALALAAEGAVVVLTGRRADPLRAVAARIEAAGGQAHIQPGDLMRAAEVDAIARFIDGEPGRLDILVNNAGLNIAARGWNQLRPDGLDEVIGGNLSSAFYCVLAVLPMMRRQRDGVLIHTASFAGRFVSPLSGPAYTAAKHGVVAMSHSINMEECMNGIRSTAICPGEVATPILDKRPVPVSEAERARMVQPEEVADLIRYVACLPPHVCLNEALISPTWNRAYVGQS